VKELDEKAFLERFWKSLKYEEVYLRGTRRFISGSTRRSPKRASRSRAT
jgi:hypothetical protein